MLTMASLLEIFNKASSSVNRRLDFEFITSIRVVGKKKRPSLSFGARYSYKCNRGNEEERVLFQL